MVFCNLFAMMVFWGGPRIVIGSSTYEVAPCRFLKSTDRVVKLYNDGTCLVMRSGGYVLANDAITKNVAGFDIHDVLLFVDEDQKGVFSWKRATKEGSQIFSGSIKSDEKPWVIPKSSSVLGSDGHSFVGFVRKNGSEYGAIWHQDDQTAQVLPLIGSILWAVDVNGRYWGFESHDRTDKIFYFDQNAHFPLLPPAPYHVSSMSAIGPYIRVSVWRGSSTELAEPRTIEDFLFLGGKCVWSGIDNKALFARFFAANSKIAVGAAHDPVKNVDSPVAWAAGKLTTLKKSFICAGQKWNPLLFEAINAKGVIVCRARGIDGGHSYFLLHPIK